jgi:hypothetical protein
VGAAQTLGSTEQSKVHNHVAGFKWRWCYVRVDLKEKVAVEAGSASREVCLYRLLSVLVVLLANEEYGAGRGAKGCDLDAQRANVVNGEAFENETAVAWVERKLVEQSSGVRQPETAAIATITYAPKSREHVDGCREVTTVWRVEVRKLHWVLLGRNQSQNHLPGVRGIEKMQRYELAAT